jgi:hypothetical protein
MNLSLRFFSNKLRIATYKSANLLNSIWKIGDPVEKSDNMLFMPMTLGMLSSEDLETNGKYLEETNIYKKL